MCYGSQLWAGGTGNYGILAVEFIVGNEHRLGVDTIPHQLHLFLLWKGTA